MFEDVGGFFKKNHRDFPKPYIYTYFKQAIPAVTD